MSGENLFPKKSEASREEEEREREREREREEKRRLLKGLRRTLEEEEEEVCRGGGVIVSVVAVCGEWVEAAGSRRRTGFTP